jgi:hypothetical protein
MTLDYYIAVEKCCRLFAAFLFLATGVYAPVSEPLCAGIGRDLFIILPDGRQAVSRPLYRR